MKLIELKQYIHKDRKLLVVKFTFGLKQGELNMKKFKILVANFEISKFHQLYNYELYSF